MNDSIVTIIYTFRNRLSMSTCTRLPDPVNNNNDNNKNAFYSAQYPKASGRFTYKNTCRMHTNNSEVKNIHKIHQKEEKMIMHKNSLKAVKVTDLYLNPLNTYF